MNKIAFILSLKVIDVFMSLFILCSFFISENAYSVKHWTRDYIQVFYTEFDGSITIRFEFIDYEFGPSGEHGYLESCSFGYSLNELHFEKLMRCEVMDQLCDNSSWATMSNKLVGDAFQFTFCVDPADGTEWADNTDVKVTVHNTSYKGFITIRWLVPYDINVKDILAVGKWRVNGLNCSEDFSEVYSIPYTSALKTEVRTDSNQKYVFDQHVSQAETIFSDHDSVIIKGVVRGENVQVYTTSGALIKSIVSDQEVVKIKLQTNQMYFVKVGQARYKVAL